MAKAKHRCSWANSNALMRVYHDTEWGVPEHDPRMLWQTLMLEGFQAGLSWEIILRKRDAFRAACANFDPVTVASFDSHDIDRLMADPGIVRARAKIEATIGGARIFNAMQASGDDFAVYCWSFTSGRTIARSGYNTQSQLSALVSKDLKARGFKFVGPTIVYAWMQAVGIVNDHEQSCFRLREIGSCKTLP